MWEYSGHFARRLRLGALLGVCWLLSGIINPWTVQAADDDPAPILYTVQAGDNLNRICGLHRQLTNHYSLTDMLSDIRRANQLESNLLRIGQTLIIPVRAPEICQPVKVPVSDGAEVRGIYLPGPACGSSSVFTRVDNFIAAGGNTVVFDAKDIDGGVYYRSAHPLASWGPNRSGPVIPSLPDMVDRFERRGLHVVARLALFLDGELGRSHPHLALADAEGAPWTERGCVWMDPGQDDVRAYNLGLARELALAGVDEIQFDYVRYPTNGWRRDWTADDMDLMAVAAERRAVITGFLEAARDSLADLDVLISADLYGIMAWDRMEDLALTGQHVPTIATLVDVICPMIYPSHFGPGFEGRARPGDDPEYFIGEGTRRFVAQAAGQAEIRPWLQAFPYRVSDYSGDYIARQVTTSRDVGGAGWCLWNPACRYTVALEVLPSLCEPAATALVLAAGPAVAEPASDPGASPSSVPAAAPPAADMVGSLVRTPHPDGRQPHPVDAP